MKKALLFLLSVLLIFCQSAAFAKPYDEYYGIVKAEKAVDPDIIDEDNIFFAEVTSHFNLAKNAPVTRFYLGLPVKNSDDFYTACFDNGKYVLTEKNFALTAPLKYFSYDEAKTYALKNGLGNPTNISALVVYERMFMYAYRVENDGASYIIPYFFTEDSLYNVTDDPECEITVGKAYTIDEFIKICEKEQLVNDEYREAKREQVKAEKPSVSVDKDGEVVDNTKPDDKKTDTAKDVPRETEAKESENGSAEKENTDVKTPEKAEETTAQSKSFADVPKAHWAYSEITDLADKNVILGYGNGYFGVDDSVTYEQLSLLLKREFDYDESNTSKTSAKREDVIVSLVKAMNADFSNDDILSINNKFDDCADISNGNEKYIAYAVKSGLVVGYNKKLNLKSDVTRAETACLIHRAINQISK